MADIIKQLAIKNASGSGFDTRDIGTNVLNDSVGRKSDGTIVTSSSETASTTESLATTLKTHETNIGGKAPTNHASSATTYGVASSTNYGHVKTSTGITNSSGTISVSYGTAAGTACQGNDSRLSDARKNPQILTISNGAATPTTVQYDGSAAKTITYSTVGAAPTSHASSATTYGVATTANYGHVKTSTGITNSSGTISVAYGTAAGTACQGNDSRLSNSRTPTAHAYSTTAYGGGTASNFGHVQLTDTYSVTTPSASTNGAATSIAPSAYALQQAYSTLNSAIGGKAPTNHASTGTGYGVATTAAYGHVKTSTGITNSSGTISVAYGTAAGTACQGNDSRLSNSRTPTAHATNSTTYGGGTASNYGHVQLTDTYSVATPSTATNGAAKSIGASAYALQQAYSTLNSSLSNKQNKMTIFYFDKQNINIPASSYKDVVIGNIGTGHSGYTYATISVYGNGATFAYAWFGNLTTGDMTISVTNFGSSASSSTRVIGGGWYWD